MNNEELALIRGGSTISGTLLNAIAKLLNAFLDVGRAIGSSIRMVKTGNKCSW